MRMMCAMTESSSHIFHNIKPLPSALHPLSKVNVNLT